MERRLSVDMPNGEIGATSASSCPKNSEVELVRTLEALHSQKSRHKVDLNAPIVTVKHYCNISNGMAFDILASDATQVNGAHRQGNPGYMLSVGRMFWELYTHCRDDPSGHVSLLNDICST
eukprot:425947_1